MSKAYENAQKRLVELRLEIIQIEQFLEIYRRFEPFQNEHPAPLVESNSPEDTTNEVKRRTTAQAKIEHMALLIENFIKEAGRPLKADQIAEEFEKRGVTIPAADKRRFVTAVIWRNNANFIRTGSNAFWLKGERMPNGTTPICYEPEEVYYAEAV